MDRLDAMRVILAVVDAGSISAGSRKLNAPLSSVSRKVAELERHLGTNLLIRTSRTVRLTAPGRDYIEAARRILSDLEEAERRASGEYQAPRGALTITMPVEFGAKHVLPIALSYMESYPEVTLNLLTSDQIVDLVDEQIDVAIRLGPLVDSNLFAVNVGEIRILTCASPRYLGHRGAPKDPRELADHDGILFGPPDVFWSFRVENEDVICTPRVRVSVNTAENNMLAAVSGAGIARVFDYQVQAQLRSRSLIRLMPEADGEPRPVHIVYPRHGLLPLKVRTFIDWAAPRLRAACSSLDSP